MCTAPDCDRKAHGRGLCVKHYNRARRASAFDRDARFGDPFRRFWSKVALPSGPLGCMEWIGACSTNGYGAFWLEGRQGAAHRRAFEVMVGPVPDGMELDHLCANRRCVRPCHLEPVTHAENLRRRGSVRIGRSGEGA